jgi:excisionase family DNA binding protein
VDYTTAQAAAHLRVTRQLIHQWIKRGKFPTARKVGTSQGGYWLIPEAELVRFRPPRMGRPRGRRTRRG